MTSSQRAVSITVRLTQPSTESPFQCSRWGASEIRPRCGFSPNSPQQAAGMRIEPAPSEAEAIGTRPAATAAALPPLEPPGVRCGFQGLRVTPKVADSVKPQIASSGSSVLPTTIAPASRSRRTISESAATGSGKPSVPRVVCSPARSVESLSAIGTPSSGRSSPPLSRASACSASSSARSASTTRNEFSRGSSRSIRSKRSRTNSVGETSPARTISACRAAPAKAISSERPTPAIRALRLRPAQGRPPRS